MAVGTVVGDDARNHVFRSSSSGIPRSESIQTVSPRTRYRVGLVKRHPPFAQPLVLPHAAVLIPQLPRRPLFHDGHQIVRPEVDALGARGQEAHAIVRDGTRRVSVVAGLPPPRPSRPGGLGRQRRARFLDRSCLQPQGDESGGVLQKSRKSTREGSGRTAQASPRSRQARTARASANGPKGFARYVRPTMGRPSDSASSWL